MVSAACARQGGRGAALIRSGVHGCGHRGLRSASKLTCGLWQHRRQGREQEVARAGAEPLSSDPQAKQRHCQLRSHCGAQLSDMRVVYRSTVDKAGNKGQGREQELNP